MILKGCDDLKKNPLSKQNVSIFLRLLKINRSINKIKNPPKSVGHRSLKTNIKKKNKILKNMFT